MYELFQSRRYRPVREKKRPGKRAFLWESRAPAPTATSPKGHQNRSPGLKMFRL